MRFLGNLTITRKTALLVAIVVLDFILSMFYILDYDSEGSIEGTISILVFSMFSLFSVVLAVDIAKSIKRLILDLEIKVEQKTQELKNLNKELKHKIALEVEKNREKDQVMYQHSRLASMGEMVGNIAHQWRQPLNALSVLIQSFSIKNMTGQLTDEFIEKQVAEGLRISKMMSNTIDDFRNFFTPNSSRKYFYLQDTIKDTIELAQERDISVTITCDKEIKIYGYQNEFSQVVLNLLNNSVDSFNIKNVKYNKNILIQIKKDSASNRAKLVFIDNGGGVDEAIIDRIFEPYFTTKHKSTGTGIGLFMSKQIIEKQMRGSISVENIMMNFDHDVYKCAKFEIELPVLETAVKTTDEEMLVA